MPSRVMLLCEMSQKLAHQFWMGKYGNFILLFSYKHTNKNYFVSHAGHKIIWTEELNA